MSNAILTSSQFQNYRKIDLIVVHCSATRCDRSFSLEAVIACHKARGFATVGYHYYITRDGTIHAGRPLYQEGAHATGFNRRSIGVCYEGGLNPNGKPADTRTPAQKETLRKLLIRLKTDYPEVRIVGHRDLPGVNKACPCFDAAREYAIPTEARNTNGKCVPSHPCLSPISRNSIVCACERGDPPFP